MTGAFIAPQVGRVRRRLRVRVAPSSAPRDAEVHPPWVLTVVTTQSPDKAWWAAPNNTPCGSSATTQSVARQPFSDHRGQNPASSFRF